MQVNKLLPQTRSKEQGPKFLHEACAWRLWLTLQPNSTNSSNSSNQFYTTNYTNAYRPLFAVSQVKAPGIASFLSSSVSATAGPGAAAGAGATTGAGATGTVAARSRRSSSSCLRTVALLGSCETAKAFCQSGGVTAWSLRAGGRVLGLAGLGGLGEGCG